MFPGLTTKLSKGSVTAAATIVAKTDILFVTGATAIATITPNFGGGFPGLLYIVPATDVLTTTTGNIQTARSLLAGLVTTLVYNDDTNKWHINSIV